jgi:hypothetical protein
MTDPILMMLTIAGLPLLPIVFILITQLERE